MGIISSFFGKKDNSFLITEEKINHFFNYAELKGGLTSLGGDVISSHGIETAGIAFEKGGYVKAYNELPAVNVPPHIMFFNNPVFTFVAFVDGKVQYYYTNNGSANIRSCAPTTNKTIIKAIHYFFEHYYNELNLPKSLEKIKTKAKNRFKITRKHKMKFFSAYLSSTDENFFIDNFIEGDEGIYDIAMWVDWKDYSLDIVEYCIDILNNNDLSVTEEDNGNVIITYKNVSTKIDFNTEDTDQDATIKTLNKVISEDYQIRFCSECDGDTLCFIPLTHKQWELLEKEYPNELNEKFQKININSTFF